MNGPTALICGVLAASAVAALGGCGPGTDGEDGAARAAPRGVSAVTGREVDAAMSAAMSRGRATLDRFVRQLDKPGPGDREAFVKARFADSAGVEYMWLAGVSYDGKAFTGTLNNTPQRVRTARLGRTYTVPRGDVVDWMIVQGGRISGAYTLRATLPQLSAEERAKMKRRLMPG